MSHEAFKHAAMDAGSRFLSRADGKTIHIATHYDADGLCSSAILQEALSRKGISFSSSHHQHLDSKAFEEIAGHQADIILFLDIGASKIPEIKERFDEKIVYVLDHHAWRSDSEGGCDDEEVFHHINPHCHDITSSNEISGAGVVYFFVLGMDQSNRDLAGLGVLGAIGDTQERDGFKELNDEILQHAILQKKVKTGRRLKLYGLNSRPLVKVLEYSSDLAIPGVTNNPEGVKELLSELRIRPSFKNGKLKKHYHLHPEQQQRLTEKILELKRSEEDESFEKMVVPSYTFVEESKRELTDLRECATVINACGRLEEYETAVQALRGDTTAKDKAVMNLKAYKASLRQALSTITESQEQRQVYRSDSLMIVDFETSIRGSIAGVVASMTVRNKVVPEEVVVCTAADVDDGTVKVSLRCGMDEPDTRLDTLLDSIVSEFGSEAGGHPNAAGAVIPAEKKDVFFEKLKASINSHNV